MKGSATLLLIQWFFGHQYFIPHVSLPQVYHQNTYNTDL